MIMPHRSHSTGTSTRASDAAPDAVVHRPATLAPALFEAARPHQAVKNLLVFLPLLASHRYGDMALLRQCMLAFVALSFAAAATYLINDLTDVAADQAHPRKRLRAIASGRVTRTQAVALATALSLLAAAISLLLPPVFRGLLGLYVLTTLGYSFGLKRAIILDVLIIAGLFTLRVLAGGAAAGIMPSFWLLAFCLFLFLSIALVKRVTELRMLSAKGGAETPGRGYRVDDLPALTAMGIASGFVAVLIVALYVNSPEIRILYRTPEMIWLICPIGLFIIARLWLLAHRGEVEDDPVLFALRDRVSQAAVALAALIAVGAR